jgi:hypothetical protein
MYRRQTTKVRFPQRIRVHEHPSSHAGKIGAPGFRKRTLYGDNRPGVVIGAYQSCNPPIGDSSPERVASSQGDERQDTHDHSPKCCSREDRTVVRQAKQINWKNDKRLDVVDDGRAMTVTVGPERRYERYDKEGESGDEANLRCKKNGSE